ncbi:SAM-dependent methyltransferase [Microbacterium dextranolyticum]|uniref:Uncharacterized protein n=1 Tax=Microbacterium dextranolyticum TaxID=36806 RepID=A0A9W6M6G9_9MICO|nr:SAM-dependent methyltransferase [Microbacterium dextranolyticum]MBM7463028.1 hypothetical protein [Microbacterium dextranolyticum]GLJ95866.1 hypothetical protein GCM10017591_19290 [Microbacterium dextranolyticum]
MSWPYLYLAGDRLSVAELCGARLDGDLVEVGDAYMPADAAETREMRAASLHSLVTDALALTRESAAWVHGAVMDAPRRHSVQRRSAVRLRHILDARLHYRERLLEPEGAMRIGGVWVTTPARTLADLVRAHCAGDDVGAYIDGLLRGDPALGEAALTILGEERSVHYTRPATTLLRERLTALTFPDAAPAIRPSGRNRQEDVTR